MVDFNKSYDGKICVITGAASGIGRALTLRLAKSGAVLALSDIDAAGLSETVALANLKASNRVMIDTFDMANAKDIAAYAPKVETALGAPDYVFNVAGIARIGEFIHTPLSAMEKVMDVNYWGVVRMSKAFIEPLMKTRGTLVNISSIFGMVGWPGQTEYCASKFAVRGFSEALAQELNPKGVAVCCVHPGGIATNIARNSEVDHIQQAHLSKDDLNAEFDKKAITTPQKAADIILRGAAKRNKQIIVGPDAKIMSFVQRLFPRAYTIFVKAYAKEGII